MCEITQGFKELYKHDQNKIKIDFKIIIKLMMENMCFIINQKQKYKEYKPPYIPKSKALDKYGFSQRKIMKLVVKENL